MEAKIKEKLEAAKRTGEVIALTGEELLFIKANRDLFY